MTTTTTLLRPAPRWTPSREAPSIVTARHAFHASQLNATCAADPSAHILSVACGTMMEASLSGAIQHGFFGRLVGVDHEERMLDTVSQSFGHLGVETIRGSAHTILSWGRDLERFDYIYTDGLYESFEERFCRRLTRRLFEMLEPGGRLLVGNSLYSFANGRSADPLTGHQLVDRTPAGMERLAADIPTHWRAATEVFVGPCRTVVYLDILRQP